jgi:predicted RNA polymerase sigma factor
MGLAALMLLQHARARGVAGALSLLPWRARRLLLELGRRGEARTAFDRAIALANPPAEAAHVRQQLDRLAADRRSG